MEIREIKKLISKKDWEKVEDLWIELAIAHPDRLSLFYDIAKELAKNGEQQRASLLLHILASHYESKMEYGKVLEILKKASHWDPENEETRRLLSNCYRELNKESPNIEKYINLSGIESDTPLRKAIPILERWLAFDVSKHFYLKELGVGKVVEVNTDFNRVTIDFEKKKGYLLKLDMAKRLLTPLGEDHFLVLKQREPERIRKMVEENPIQLLELLLRSFNKPLPSKEIREYLSGVIDPENWNRWWETAKRILEKHPKVKVSQGTPRYYEWYESSEEIERDIIENFREADPHGKLKIAQQFGSKNPQLAAHFLSSLVELGNGIVKKNPSLAIELYFLSNELRKNREGLGFIYTPEALVRGSDDIHTLVMGIREPRWKRLLLQTIKTVHEESWPHIFASLFFDIEDRSIWNFLSMELARSGKNEFLGTIAQRVLSNHNRYPERFFWLCRKTVKGGFWRQYLTYDLLYTLLTLLESKGGRRLRSRATDLLCANEFEFVKLALQKAKKEDVKRLVRILTRAEKLDQFQRDGIESVLRSIQPELFSEKEEEDIIWATAQTLLKKQQELRHILEAEIPKNSEEIAKAASLGDLSENYEYKAAKEKQEMLFRRAERLRGELKKARMIDTKKIDLTKVVVGTKVKLRNLSDRSLREFTILGQWESNPEKGVISHRSPIGKELLGKRVRERVQLSKVEYEIVEIGKGL